MGVLSAFAYTAVDADSYMVLVETGHFRNDLIHAAASGALLSPLCMRERVLRRVDAALVKSLVQRVGGMIALVLLFCIATRSMNTVPSLWVGFWAASTLSMAVAGRALSLGLIRWAARHFAGERVAVIGRGAEADWLRSALRQARPAGIDLVPPGRRSGSFDGAVADLVEQGQRGMLHRVILAQPGLSDSQLRKAANGLKSLRIEVASLFPPLGSGAYRPMTNVADIPLFILFRRPQGGFQGLAKSLMDRGLALLLLLWTSPLLALIALAVRLDSPGPILFRQRRDGMNGTEFDIYKFRTMVWEGKGSGNGAVQTRRNDQRITRLGRWLRLTSLDEVPQLLNVLNGTMSLVGPRPHPKMMRTEARLGAEITPEYPHRCRVKPGITGWAQVNGLRGATETAEQLRQRIEYDNFYIENWSPWFDLRILAMTPVSLLFRRANAF